MIARLYDVLLREYGPRGWWPLASMAGRPGFDDRGYHPRIFSWPRTPAQRFEIAMGAVLTQNTAWSNAEKALASLLGAGVDTPRAVLGCTAARLASLARSSGYHNQKARALQALAGCFEGPPRLGASRRPDRDELLGLWGIGEETADSILLYAFSHPVFVVDAYTRRVLARIGLIRGNERYAAIQAGFHDALPAEPALFNEYHALIVAHAKACCRASPSCGDCPVPRCRERSRTRTARRRPRS